MNLRIAGITEESIVDGPGIRYTIFTQGCPHACMGCHNPESWDYNGGYTKNTDEIINEFKENPLLKGITFSGGEPFLQAEALLRIAKAIHELGKNVVTYTGYTFEELQNSDFPFINDLLLETDILVDGKFIESQKNLELLFRGSENQRLIDVNMSVKNGHLTLIEE